MLTIIIPSYNHQDYIIECLCAATRVPISEKKIVVIDDGSKDDTPKLIKNFISNNSKDNIILIEKENSGLISSLNLALDIIETEFTYIIASDDILNPTGIKYSLEQLKKDEHIKFLIGNGEYLFANNRKSSIYRDAHKVFFNLPPIQREKEIFINYPSPLLIQSTVFRTDALRHIGGWDTSLIWDDYPIFVKLLLKYPIEGKNFYFRPCIYNVYYRQHHNNSYKDTYRQFFMVKQALEKLAPEELKKSCVSKKEAYYLLLCLKRKDIVSLLKILRSDTCSILAILFFRLPLEALSIIGKKLRN